jgi:cell division transport system permease protein
MMGVLGMLLVKSNQITAHFKEKVAITVFLKDRVTPAQTKKLEELLHSKSYTKTTRFLSKDKAAEIYSKDIGEDFLEFLGKNPLKNSIDIYLKADFVSPLKMTDIKNELLENTYVTEVVYDEPLIQLLTQNIQKISFWILVIAAFFALVAILLINSSIRLSVHSKRFTIKTMQMVGATKRFIRRPFVWRGVRLGLVGAFLASFGLGFLSYYLSQYFPELQLWSNKSELLMVVAGLFLTGFLITWLSTFFATQRFLNLKTDQLYES